MQFPREVSRPSTVACGPFQPTEIELFLALLQEGLGEELCGLLESARLSSTSSFPLAEFSADVRDKLRLIAASDAMRLCLEHRYDLELTCTAEDTFELRSVGRNSRPPIVTEEVCADAQNELPLAMGIVHLVIDRAGHDVAGYYAHTPIGLAADERDQLVRLMSTRLWRKALEMRYGLHFGFRAPYHLAAARVIDNNYLRQFVSLEEQVRTGLFLSDP